MHREAKGQRELKVNFLEEIRIRRVGPDKTLVLAAAYLSVDLIAGLQAQGKNITSRICFGFSEKRHF